MLSGFRDFGQPGFRELSIYAVTPALALVSNFVRDAEWQNWSSQGRPTWTVAHTRAVKAGSYAVLLIGSFCAETRAASLFESSVPATGIDHPIVGQGSRFCPPQPSTVLRVEGRPSC